MEKRNLPKTKKRDRWAKRDTELTLLTLPTVIWYICFCYFPMFGILMAFKNYKLIDGTKSFFYNLLKSEFTGFKNFEFLFTSGSGALVVKLTLLYNIVFIILGIVIPVCLSLMMSQLYSKRADAQQYEEQERVQGISDHDVPALLYVMGRCHLFCVRIFKPG